MRISNCRKITSLCFMLCAPVTAQNLYWQKNLPSGSKLVVLRKIVPYAPPTAEEIKEKEKRFKAKVTPRVPKRVWLYTLQHFKNGKTFKLCQLTIPEYLRHPQFQFYDAYWEGNNLAIIYKPSYYLVVQVLSREKVGGEFEKGPLQILESEGIQLDRNISSVNFKGSFKDKNLLVQVKRGGNLQIFAWKNKKWIEQVQKNGKWIDKIPAKPSGIKAPQR